MRITIPSDVLAHVCDTASSEEVGMFYARNRDAGRTFQIVSVTSEAATPDAGDVTSSTDIELDNEIEYTSRLYTAVDSAAFETIPYAVHEDPNRRESAASDLLTAGNKSLALSIVPNEDTAPVGITNSDVTPMVDVVPAGDEMFERVSGIVDTDYLADTTITIVGLGTTGSTVAVELAKCGVGTFHLFDPDHLEVHNIARHVCDLRDIGRKKTAAVAERIKSRHPGATVHTNTLDVTSARPDLRDAILDSDCIVVCTDTQISRAVINEEAVAAETTAVYGGAYERAYGGDVMRVRGDSQGPCYACVFGTPDANAQAARNSDGSIDYSQASDAANEDFNAEPGLSVDVGFIALLQTRYVIETLLESSGHETTTIPHDISVWGNRPEEQFSKHFEHQYLDQETDPDCGVCGPDGTADRMRDHLYGASSGVENIDHPDTTDEGS